MKDLVLRLLGRTSPTQDGRPASSREQPAVRRSLLPAFLRDRRGSAAVEMAFVMPIVLLILVGMIQYGSIFYTQHMMVYAAREVARSFSMGEITATQAQARALELLAPSGPKQFNVSVAETGGVTSDVTVTIDMLMADAALINLPINLITGNVTASVTMRVL